MEGRAAELPLRLSVFTIRRSNSRALALVLGQDYEPAEYARKKYSRDDEAAVSWPLMGLASAADPQGMLGFYPLSKCAPSLFVFLSCLPRALNSGVLTFRHVLHLCVSGFTHLARRLALDGVGPLQLPDDLLVSGNFFKVKPAEPRFCPAFWFTCARACLLCLLAWGVLRCHR